MPLDAGDEYLRRCMAIIDRVGWMIQGVFSTPEAPGPTFCYTVGLTPHGSPELAIAGLPPRVAQVILNDLAGRVFDQARRYRHGEILCDVPPLRNGGLDVVIVEGDCSLETIWPGIAHALYGEAAVRLQQVVWPDDRGRFPWDAAYALALDVQPVIGRAGPLR